METINIIFLLLLITISILIIAIYVYVFDIQDTDDNKNKLLILGLESMDVENYLIQGKTVPNNLLTFYDQPSVNPYVDISYEYNQNPDGLIFYIYDDQNNVVNTSKKTIKNVTNNFKVERIYFKNVKSEYYIIKYTLEDNIINNDNIQISRIALNV